MAIDIGPLELNETLTLNYLKRDLLDDWFPDARKFDDILANNNIQTLIANNVSRNEGEYLPSNRSLLNIPKSNFTLRYTLETSIVDRAIYIGLVANLIHYYDPLLPWNVFSHRLNTERKKNKYMFKMGVKAWQDFIGVIQTELTENCVLLSTDLTNYFENIDLATLKNVLIDLIPETSIANEPQETINTIELLFKYLQEWAYSKNRGLPQNRDASSFLANIYMLSIDNYMIQNGYKYYRYMDDIKIVCDDTFSARKALKTLCVKLREYGLAVNSGKTEIIHASNTEHIKEHLDVGNLQLQQLDSIWQSKSLPLISRSFDLLKEITIKLLQEGKADSREFRFCIKRLDTLANCSELEVPSEYFSPITPHIISLIQESPASSDQLVKYLLSVELEEDQLAELANFLENASKSFYTWQNYKLWLLLAHKKYVTDNLLALAHSHISTGEDTPTRSGASIYLGAVGAFNDRVSIAKEFKTLTTFMGQRSALISIHELPFRPIIEDFVKPHLREDLHSVYRFLNQEGKGKYLAEIEKVPISQIIEDERES